MKRIIYLLTMLLPAISYAQETGNSIEMADALRASGKIYVVVIVLVVIVTGLLLYLITIDRKLGKLEKEFKSKTEA